MLKTLEKVLILLENSRYTDIMAFSIENSIFSITKIFRPSGTKTQDNLKKHREKKTVRTEKYCFLYS